MSIKTETSYGNISWKGSTGCSLIGITGTEKSRLMKCRLAWNYFYLFPVEIVPFYVFFKKMYLLTCFSFSMMNLQAELYPG